MSEPKGCPTPGACSAVAQIAALEKERDHWREAYFKTMTASDSIIKAMSAACSIIEIERQRVRDALENSARLIEERNDWRQNHDHILELSNKMLAAAQAQMSKVSEIVVKMRADLKSVGGFDNRFIGQPSVNIREYIMDLEDALEALPADTSALDARLAQERERVALQFNSGSLHNLAVQEKIRSMK